MPASFLSLRSGSRWNLCIAGIAILTSTMEANASDPDREMASCFAIAGSVERLACYDDLAKSRGAEPRLEQSTISPGKWQIHRKKSPIDDSENVYAALDSNESFAGRIGSSEPLRLIVRCQENKTDVSIYLAGYWGSDRFQTVTRLDRAKAQRREWSESTDHEWLFHPEPIAFARALMRASELFFSTIPFNESSIDATFDLTGSTAAIEAVQHACGW